jgi:hypothetical protein
VSLFGVRPGPPHLVNLALHVAGTVACFLVLAALTGRVGPSAAVAMLVGWHPTRVESVAWIAERKDVLSMLFAWGTLGAWFAYVRVPSRRRFALALAAFAARGPLIPSRLDAIRFRSCRRRASRSSHRASASSRAPVSRACPRARSRARPASRDVRRSPRVFAARAASRGISP